MEMKKLLSATVLAIALLFTGCGNDASKETDKKDAPKEEQAKEDKTKETAKDEKESKGNEKGTEKGKENENTAKDEDNTTGSASKATGDNEVLNTYIAEETQGDVSVLFTNKDPKYEQDMDGFKVTVDEYQIVQVKDMHADMAMRFKDETDGYVVTAKVTIDNQTDKAMYYPLSMTIQRKDMFDTSPADTHTFVREEDRLKSKKESETSKFAAGEKVTGLVTFRMTNEEFDGLAKVQPKLIINGGAADNKDFKGRFHGEAAFDFIYSDDQQKKVAEQPDFYNDRLVTDNMAEKKMIFEKTDINESENLKDVKVTLEGVQYTEITPTNSYKKAFKNFGNDGIVAITVKFSLDNQSKQTIGTTTSSKISVDGNRGTVLSAGLDPNARDLKPGAKSEKLEVFLLRKDEFELFKTFDIAFGPLYDENAKDISKGQTVKFKLPNK